VSEDWYARPILCVADVDRTLDFYVNKLGFTQAWRFEEDGKAFVAQADRRTCALIFSSQWPDKVGKGLIFISLGADEAVDRLRIEFEGKGVHVEDGYWGYPLLVVRDPDGNELFFNYPDPGPRPAKEAR
jgi:catechol 2,3-dioxygenase-like lactoylglutathione lyase family enzyme